MAQNVLSLVLSLANLEGIMSYRIVEGYVYPSNKGAIGAISILLIIVALIVLFYFTGIYVGTLLSGR